MRIYYDPDEYETVIESRPCTTCNGDSSKCNGGCNGSTSLGRRRRAPEEVAKIKAEKQRAHEEAVLAEAAAIMAMRSLEKSSG